MENRIATERRRFNELGQDFNTSIRRFPRNVWAGIFDFNRRNYFESSEVAEVAPDIKSMREGK
jgi:LemA protein